MTPSRIARRATALAVCALGAAAARRPPPRRARPATSLPTSRRRPPSRSRCPRRSRRRTRSWRANPVSNIHNDTWMTDAYQHAGPLGRNLQATSGAHAPSLCGSLAFDKAGHIVSVCPSTFAAPQARVFDPKTLEVLATYDMPDAPEPARAPSPSRTSPAAATSSSTARTASGARPRPATCSCLADRATTAASSSRSPTTTSRGCSTTTSASPRRCRTGRAASGSSPRRTASIGVLDTKTGKIETITLDEEIENSFAVDRDGVYIASDKRMYRFNAGKDNKPVVDWKVTYKNSGITKPSQVDAGTGTTPTIFNGGDYVTITDNADPMNVVVYRTAKKLRQGHQARRLRDAGLRQGRQRDRELDHRRRPLAVRREQLRLPGPVRPERRRPDDRGLRARRRQREGHAAARCAGRTRPRPCRPSSPSCRPRPA